jgi:threonine synthase
MGLSPLSRFVRHLACFACGTIFPADRLQNLCTCGRPLRVEYDLAAAAAAMTKASLKGRDNTLWRYREVLPYPLELEPPTLGEGGTPLLPAADLAKEIGLRPGCLLIKDEAVNPTGSFKARGMAVAVAMAVVLGADSLAVPSAGNAGGAMAAYAARNGVKAHVFMPRDVPMANRLECEMAGADVTLVDGLINDCGRIVAERKAAEGWFDLSTLKEPYRAEGKKTMGYELAEQLHWSLPDVILYPTGGGTGLVGMAKAFDEMEAMGWIDGKRPRMVSVQAEGCQPIVRAFEAGADEAPLFENAHTVAAGLRVPKAVADFVMLDILRRTRGTAVSVSDAEMISEARTLNASTGVCAAPEGGACLAALKRLRRAGWISPTDKVVLFNTGSGLKYSEAFAAYPKG